MDWYSRKVLSWRISNTLDTDFCVEALFEALSGFERPEIFNTDQGAQFTSNEFTELLSSHNVQISMDGRSRVQDMNGSGGHSSTSTFTCGRLTMALNSDRA